jgi:NAD(P)-dependent dehydrogenase (short-subunit alcohol dehydrogenase family)
VAQEERLSGALMAGANYPDLAGKSVVVTGGGGGIGAAITRRFVEQNARVSFFDIDEASSLALVTDLGGPERVAFHRVDLTDVEELQGALARVAATQGDVDILINNAGWDERKSLPDVTPAFFDQVIAINLKHTLFAAQAVVPGMQKKGGGVIVTFSSISWMLGSGGMPAYTASKSAMLGLTRSMARDFGVDNIRVNAVAPGWVDTPRQRERWLTPEGDKRRLDGQCLKHWVKPEHIANVVVFLASSEAAMCTGQHYVVDGGWV